MKKVPLIVLLILLYSTSYGQTKKDSAIIQYIQTKAAYISLTDSTNIPGKLIPYYGLILDYLAKHNMNKSDYYIWISYIKDDTNSLTIPICHYDGFVIIKGVEEENKKAFENKKPGEPYKVTQMVGNASGRDGSLEIDKQLKKVVGFRLSE